MSEGILNSEDLKEITGYKLDGPLKNFLENQGIAVFNGKNGIWTTMELVKAAGLNKMGIAQPEKEKEEQEWL